MLVDMKDYQKAYQKEYRKKQRYPPVTHSLSEFM